MTEGDIVQVAHVVRDLDRAMKFYWDAFNAGPWGVYSFAPPDVRESMVYGKPADFSYLAERTTRTSSTNLDTGKVLGAIVEPGNAGKIGTRCGLPGLCGPAGPGR